jgi:hypothetical protein
MRRQFGRDTGDTYGRHALVNPGGDNRQIDVLHLVPVSAIRTDLFDPDYVGTHRASWWDVQVDR